MTSRKRIHSQSIYYFERGENEDTSVNSLKEFIYFLKYKGVKENIDFSYSNESDTLHCQMSIKENFLLDSVPTSLIKDNENSLKEFINSINNTYLKSLIFSLGDLDQKVADLSKNHLKLTSIIKTILSQSAFMFLNAPDKNLDSETLEIVKKCLLFEVKNNNRTVLLKSHRKIIWPEIITNIITKDSLNQFIDTPNPFYEKRETKIAAPKYTFTLNKKAS